MKLSSRKSVVALIIAGLLPLVMLAGFSNASHTSFNSTTSAQPYSDATIGKLNWLQQGYHLPANESMWSTVVLNYTGYVEGVILPYNASVDDIGATVEVSCYVDGTYRAGGDSTIQQNGILWSMATQRPEYWSVGSLCPIERNLVEGSSITMLIVASQPLIVLGTYGAGTSYFSPMSVSSSPPTTIPKPSGQASFLVNIYGG